MSKITTIEYLLFTKYLSAKEKMLKAPLLALLIIGCVAASETYDKKSSHDEFNFKTKVPFFKRCCYQKFPGERPVFPQITPKGQGLPINFIVKRESEYVLLFEPQLARGNEVHFSVEEDVSRDVQLISMKFEFTAGDVIRFHLDFKSTSSNKLWTVVSRVFGKSPKESHHKHAEDTAVIANTLTISLVVSLESPEQDDQRRQVSFDDMGWVLELLKKNPPRLNCIDEDNHSKKCFRSLPLVVDGCLTTLETVKDRMPIYGL